MCYSLENLKKTPVLNNNIYLLCDLSNHVKCRSRNIVIDENIIEFKTLSVHFLFFLLCKSYTGTFQRVSMTKVLTIYGYFTEILSKIQTDWYMKCSLLIV